MAPVNKAPWVTCFALSQPPATRGRPAAASGALAPKNISLDGLVSRNGVKAASSSAGQADELVPPDAS